MKKMEQVKFLKNWEPIIWEASDYEELLINLEWPKGLKLKRNNSIKCPNKTYWNNSKE